MFTDYKILPKNLWMARRFKKSLKKDGNLFSACFKDYVELPTVIGTIPFFIFRALRGDSEQ